MAHCDYQFRSMTADDLPMVRRWLQEPHVVEWWGNADEQFALVRGDLDVPEMSQFVVSAGTRAFAYLQCYNLRDWPQEVFSGEPAGSHVIDHFIGEPAMIGRGHGSSFIRCFTDDLLKQGVPCVITDPDPANTRAICAAEKAGFRKRHIVETIDGPALLMVRTS